MTEPLVPVLWTASQVAFLDDDPLFLEAVDLVLRRTAMPKSFHSSRESLEPLLAKSAAALSAERQLLGRVANAQLPDSDDTRSIVRALEYFANCPRLDIIGGLVVDFAMPGEDGISFFKKHGQPGTQRMLLTGLADERQAVAAFNAGGIERFVPKQTDWSKGKLQEEIEDLLLRSAFRRGEALADAISKSTMALLRQGGVAHVLKTQLARWHIAEYVVLGVPQGILGLTTAGDVVWVQLETEDTLAALLEECDAERDRWSAAVRSRIAAGDSLLNLHCAAQLDLQPFEEEAIQIGNAGKLLAAPFRLDGLPDDLLPRVRASS